MTQSLSWNFSKNKLDYPIHLIYNRENKSSPYKKGKSMNIKNTSLNIFMNAYLGKDENKMSVFDRIVGVVKRQRKKTAFVQDIKIESLNEIKYLEGFSLTELELEFALIAAILYTE